jgi:hypothetical protein
VGSEPLGKFSTLLDSSTAYKQTDSSRHEPFCRILNKELLQFYYSCSSGRRPRRSDHFTNDESMSAMGMFRQLIETRLVQFRNCGQLLLTRWLVRFYRTSIR